MSKPRPQAWQLQALAAKRRDDELRRADELKKVADYFEVNTTKSKRHEQWTTDGYYEKAKREAELLSERKIRESQLEERRKKLEMMFFKENMQFEQELKELAAKPKLYKNGSFLNNVSTSTLEVINQGIREKEEELRKHEAELKRYHAWRIRQPELRAANSYMAHGKLKSAWMEQIVEKEIQKKKEEEEARKILQERDKALRLQIEMEKQRQKDKENKMRDLRNALEDQIAELSEKEKAVKQLRMLEDREKLILDELKYISSEREREHERLVSERDTHLVNMGLHKYKLKKKVMSVLKEIELDLVMLEKIRVAVLKDYEQDRDKCANYKQVLDTALKELEEHRDRERTRQMTIEAMYDGEARQINEKQDLMWAKERDARAKLMREVVSTLSKQVEEKIERNRQQQRANVLERERLLEDMEQYHQEVKERERDVQLKNSSYANINTLQSQLKSLKLKQEKLDAAAERENQLKEAIARERAICAELGRAHRRGSSDIWD